MIPQSTEKPEPLVSDEQLCGRVEIGKIGDHVRGMHRPPGPLPVIQQTRMTAEEVRDIYEADRLANLSRIASLEAQVKAMREAGNKMAEAVGQVAYEAEERGSLTPHATCIASAEELADNWNHLAKSLDTPTPPNK